VCPDELGKKALSIAMSERPADRTSRKLRHMRVFEQVNVVSRWDLQNVQDCESSHVCPNRLFLCLDMLLLKLLNDHFQLIFLQISLSLSLTHTHTPLSSSLLGFCQTTLYPSLLKSLISNLTP
jgi:hypothetical protein